MGNLPVMWTSHLKEDEKKDFADSVRNSRHILDRLEQIVQSKIDSNDRWAAGPDMFSNPNYTHLLAYVNGYVKALREIQELINLKG